MKGLLIEVGDVWGLIYNFQLYRRDQRKCDTYKLGNGEKTKANKNIVSWIKK